MSPPSLFAALRAKTGLPCVARLEKALRKLPRFAASEAWWRRRESNPRPQWSHLHIYVCILSFCHRQGNCEQTRHYLRQSQHQFARDTRDACRELSCCRRSDPPSRCQWRNALPFFRQRVLILYQHVLFRPDFLRGQPDILDTQPKLQPARRNRIAPLRHRKRLLTSYPRHAP